MWDWRGSDLIGTCKIILLTPHTWGCLVINDYLFGQIVVCEHAEDRVLPPHHCCREQIGLNTGLTIGWCVSSLSLWLTLLTPLHIRVQAVHLGVCSPGTSRQAASASPIKSSYLLILLICYGNIRGHFLFLLFPLRWEAWSTGNAPLFLLLEFETNSFRLVKYFSKVLIRGIDCFSRTMYLTLTLEIRLISILEAHAALPKKKKKKDAAQGLNIIHVIFLRSLIWQIFIWKSPVSSS